MSRNVSLNVRFALWSRDRELRRDDRRRWIEWLATRSGLPHQFCRDLLLGRVPDEAVTAAQLESLARALELPDDGAGLRFEDPLARTKVLQANLRFLFNQLEHGRKKAAAASLGIAQTTISRWLSGATEPEGPNLEKLVSHFQLPWGTDLRKDPIFLSLEPVSSQAKRHWVRDRLDKVSEQDLQDLYPALRRMLDDDQ